MSPTPRVADSGSTHSPTVHEWLTTEVAAKRLGLLGKSLRVLDDDLSAVIERRSDTSGWLWSAVDVRRLVRIRRACPRLSLADSCAVLGALKRGEL